MYVRKIKNQSLYLGLLGLHFYRIGSYGLNFIEQMIYQDFLTEVNAT
jgi:hypothetical protein